MGGFFGVASRRSCTNDLFYGTDYHSHLGTKRAGMAVWRTDGRFRRIIHNISNAQFRSKFEDQLGELFGNSGIGVISDYEDQPLLMTSHHGTYGIVSVNSIYNFDELTREFLADRKQHFAATTGVGVNPTEVIAALIDTQPTIVDGLRYVQERIQGSCSVLIITEGGTIYAMRDRFGRVPMIIGRNDDGFAVGVESTALPNIGYAMLRDMGPGEIVKITADSVHTESAALDKMQICAFFWIYFGFPSSTYEGLNVEEVRYRCGASLAKRAPADADIVTGVPDSGVGHALGFSLQAGVPYKRPFVKYTPTWPRSFMPPDQDKRQLIANKKLVVIPELVKDKKLVCCDDSIVRGTQMRNQAERLYGAGARELHMRIACPPLMYGCKFLNFSRSSSEDELVARRIAHEIAGENADLSKFTDPDSPEYTRMVEEMRKRLNLTSLAFLRLDDMIESIGLPKDRICTYCWDGRGAPCCGKCKAESKD